GLLALVMATAEAGATMPAHRVELVDENDAGSLLLRLVEHVAHTRCPDADEHLDEVGTGYCEERYFRLARDGFGQQGLAGTRRPDHQHAFGDFPAEPLELARVSQEIDDFGYFGFCLIDTRDIRERDVHLVFTQEPCLALAERHRAASAAATLHLPHEVDPHAYEEQYRERTDEQLADQALGFRLLGGKANVVLFQDTDERVVVGLGADRVIAERRPVTVVNALAVKFRPLHVSRFHLLQELGVIRLLRRGSAHATQALHDRQQHHDDDDKNKDVLG